MKLKTRLQISFFSIVLVPVILMGIVYNILQEFQVRGMQGSILSKDGEKNYLMNTIDLINEYTDEISTEIVENALKYPEKMENRAYLNEYNEKLRELNSYLVVQKGSNPIYVPDDRTVGVLPKSNGEVQREGRILINDDRNEVMKQYDFNFKDGEDGNFFIITSTQKLMPKMREIIFDIVLSAILILLFTAGIMTLWIYKGIMTPVKKLQSATKKIKDGNLDFVVDTKGTDEIGQLCMNFEEMRQRLKESAEEKIQNENENRLLISNIAHDLKTPITAIKGYAEGILDHVADTPEKKEKYIKTIYNKATEMDRLINELTIYTKIDTNKIPYNFQKIGVGDFFDDCVEDLTMELEDHNIKLSYFNYTNDAVQIIADPEQLRRVINNIIGNAMKYMDKQKGMINIRIKDVGDFIQVEVEDNGKGIASKDLPYIFERFYRADTSRNSNTGGSGIGLSIVKKIMEDHGGKIWATSKEHTGTVLYFVIRKYQEVVNE